MPKLVGKRDVGVSILTSESGGHFIDNLVEAYPDGGHALELLVNGGGKSTLTEIEGSVLAPWHRYKRPLKDYFRDPLHPTYVVFEVATSRSDVVAGYGSNYVIGAFVASRKADRDGDRGLARSWAIVPKATSGLSLGELPLCSKDERGVWRSSSIESVKSWVRSAQGTWFQSDSRAAYAAALRQIGISVAECDDAAELNTVEDGFDKFFGNVSSETLFNDKLVSLVSRDVKDMSYLKDELYRIVELRRSKEKTYGQIEQGQRVIEAMAGLRKGVVGVRDARYELGRVNADIHAAGNRLSEIKADLEDKHKLADQAVDEAEERLDNLRYIKLSAYWYEMYDARETARSDMDAAETTLAKAEGEKDSALADKLFFEAVEAKAKLNGPEADLLKLAAQLRAAQERHEERAAKADRLQRFARWAYHSEDDRLTAIASSAESKARENERAFEDATRVANETERRLVEAQTKRDQLAGRVEVGQERVGTLAEGYSSMVSPSVFQMLPDGRYDVSFVRGDLEAANKRVSDSKSEAVRLETALEKAKSGVEDARAKLMQAKTSLDAAVFERDAADKVLGAAEDAWAKAKGNVFLLNLHASESADAMGLMSEVSARLNKVRSERGELAAKRSKVNKQLDLIGDGHERIPQELLAALDEENVRGRTLREIVDGDKGRMEFFLNEAPWMADVLFVSPNDLPKIEDALSSMPSADPFTWLLSSGTPDELVIGTGSLHVVSNVNVQTYVDSDEMREQLLNEIAAIDERDEGLKNSETVASAALEDCRAFVTSLGGHASLADARAASAQAQESLSEQESRHKVAKEGLSAAQAEMAAAKTSLENANASVSSAVEHVNNLKKIEAALVDCNNDIERMESAEQALGNAKIERDKAAVALGVAKHGRIDAASAMKDALAARDDWRKKITLLDPERDGLSEQDTEGRSLEELAAERDALQAQDDDVAELKERYDKAKPDVDDLQRKFNEALGESGCSLERVSAAALNYDPDDKTKAELRLADAEKDVEAGSAEREKCSLKLERAEGAFDLAKKQLADAEHDSPAARGMCVGVDVKAQEASLTEARSKAKAEGAALSKEIDEVKKTVNEVISLQLKADRGKPLGLQPSHRFDGMDFVAVTSGVLSLREKTKEALQGVDKSKDEFHRISSASEFNPESFSGNNKEIMRSNMLSARSMLDSSYDNMSLFADKLEAARNAIDMSVRDLRLQVSELDKCMDDLVVVCSQDVERMIRDLGGICKNADFKMVDTHGNKKDASFLTILVDSNNLKELVKSKDDGELYEMISERIREHLEHVAHEIESGSMDDNKLNKAIDYARLIREAMKSPDGKGIVTVLVTACKEHEIKPNVTWEWCIRLSGGESQVMKFALFLSIIKYRRESHLGASKDDRSFVFIDNPFGSMNHDILVDYFRQIADHFGYQVVARTGLHDKGVLKMFPNVISLSANRVTSSGRRLIGVASHEGGDAYAGVEKTISSVTTSYQMSLNDLPEEEDPGQASLFD